MARPLAKPTFVLFAIGLLLFSSSATIASDDDLEALNQRVVELCNQGKYQEAIPLAEKAVDKARRSRAPEDIHAASSLHNLATLYDEMGEYTKAEPLYLQALRIWQKVSGPEGLDTANVLNSLAVLYMDMGEYAKAEPLYQQALRIYQKVSGPEHPDTVSTLSNLAELYQTMGEYAKAEPLLKESLRIRQKVLGPKHPNTADSLNNLALLYQAMGEYAKAEPLFQESLRISQKALGLQHPDTVNRLNNLAELYKDMGKYAKAEPLLIEALRIRQKVLGPEHPGTATSLNNLADLYQSRDEYAKAEPLYQEALRIWQKVLGPEHPNIARSLDNLADLYMDIGEYAKAEPLFQEALRIWQKVLGPEHPDTAKSLNNLAGLYDQMGEYTKAEPLCQEALRIRQKVLGPESPETAQSLDSLSSLYCKMGEYAKAEPLCQEALRIRQKVLGPEHPDTARSLNNLATFYEARGEYAKAESLYQEAFRIWRKVLGPEHEDTAASLNNLAALYEYLGEYAKAEGLYQQSLRIVKKVLGSENPKTIGSLDNLALLEFDLGRIDRAIALTREAYSSQLGMLSKILSFTSEQQRLAYLDIFNPYSRFSFLEETKTDLATAVLRYKGVVLDSIIEDRLLAGAVEGSEDQKRVERLDLDKRQLGQLLLEPAQKVSAENKQRIESLEEEVGKIEGELAQHVAGLGRARRALTVQFKQVQQAIPNDGALVEYLRYFDYLGKGRWELRYGAAVLLSEGDPIWIPLGSADQTEKLVRRYGTLVKGSPQEEELSANLRALYAALWAQIEQALPSGIKRIVISPDGQLNFISFATLLDKDKQFLAEKYSIQYVASGRDLLREPKPSTAKEVVLFANPDFDFGSATMLVKADTASSDPGSRSIRGNEKRDIEDWSFAPLGGTEKEGDELAEKFKGWDWAPTELTVEKATKEALLKVHSPYILHMATHGFFAKEDPSAAQTESPALPDDQKSVTKSKFFKNPMHRSGLALAGAQTTIEAWKHDEVPPVENDGILTAEDVSTLDLQGTWLVTLSACDTGSGEARAGEGVMGLRRGFIQAGAQNLLMTLWPISDEVTVQIMSDFYDAAHESGNAPQALAKVQREWLVKLRTEKGLAQAVNLAGPFIMSSQGRP